MAQYLSGILDNFIRKEWHRRTDSDETVASCQLAIRNGLFLLITLILFRIEKILLFKVHLDAQGWITAFVPEIGSVLVIEALLAIVAIAIGSIGYKVWKGVFYGSHVLLYILAVVEHQFLIKTGTQIDVLLITYSAQHAGELFGVVSSGIDTGLVIRILLALACFGLGVKSNPPKWVPNTIVPIFLVTALLVGPVLIMLARPAGGTGTPFSTRIFVDFFLPLKKDRLEEIATTIRPHKIYEPPRVLLTSPGPRPNIILLILESTRAAVVPPYRETTTNIQTPFFSKIAREGIVFENVYTTVPHTSKALVGILCGMYPRLIQPISESEESPLPLRCLPHLLKEIGYRTKFLQTAKGEFENRPGLVRNVGFDSWLAQENFPDTFQKTGYFGMDEFAMIEPATRWAAQTPGQPFFLTILTVSTHHPYQSPGMDGWPKPGEEFQGYLRAIQHLDRFAGTLYAEFSKRNLLDDTVVIVVGDHGEAFGEHYRMQHDVVPYEEGIRVPLYLHGPDWVGPARHIDGLRHHVDLLPTILELVGIQWEGKLPGESLLTSSGHPFVVSSCWYTDFCMALRQENWKFIYHFGRKTPEVFHLGQDPRETINRIQNIPMDLEETAWKNMLTLKASVDRYYTNPR